MISKARQIEMFLLPGMILAIAAIYVFPMQQAMACGCDGGGKKGGGSGGSLVNVQDNNIGNVEKNKVLSNDKILSNNKIKDVNVLSNNKIKDVNVLSKNDGNKFQSYNEILSGVGKQNNIQSYNEILSGVGKQNTIKDFDFNVLNDYYKKACGC